MIRISLFPTLFLMLFSMACSPESSIKKIDSPSDLRTFKALKEPHYLNLLRNGEAGRPLFLCLTILEGPGFNPLAGKEVFVYQADASGNYQSVIPGKEITAKISGTCQTDNHGRIFIKTLLPGDYGSEELNRHIQFQIEGAYPFLHRVYFKQFANCDIRQNSKNDLQSHLVKLQTDEASNLVGFLQIRVNDTSPPPQDLSTIKQIQPFTL